MALRLRRHGVARVRPLAGGLAAWRELGYPLARLSERRPAATPAADGDPAPPAPPIAG